MKDFELAQPSTPQEAVSLLTGLPSEHIALAGGQDILALMKDYVEQPTRLVNLKGLPALNKIEQSQGKLVLGCLVTLTDLAESQAVQKSWPILAEAAATAATPQIRNLGTVGGNLAQRPRCWYYRAEELVCLRKGGDHCMAQVGDNRYHGIFGGPCFNPNMSSLAGPLIAYGAQVEIIGGKGRRYAPVATIYDPYDGNSKSDLNLAPDDIITHVIVPAAAGWRLAHNEVRFRESHDWPLAMCTAALDTAGGTTREARLVLGAVAASPLVSEAAAAVLKGKRVTPELAAQAAEASVKDATPLSMNAFKVPLTRNLVRRTILEAAGLVTPAEGH